MENAEDNVLSGGGGVGKKAGEAVGGQGKKVISEIKKRYFRNVDGVNINSVRTTPKSGTQPVGSTVQKAETVSKAIKKSGKRSIRTAQKSIKSAEKTVKTSVRTSQAAAKAAAKTAQTSAQASKMAAQTARASAKAAAVTAKTTAKIVAAAVKATIAAIKELVAAIAAGGWVAVVIIIIIVLVAMIVCSPFGIFANGGGDNTPTLSATVQMLNDELNKVISDIETQAGPVDKVVFIPQHAGADTSYITNWDDILAVWAVKTGMGENPQNVVIMDENKVISLRQVMNDMVSVTSTISVEEDNPIPPSDDNTSSQPIKLSVLTIKIIEKSYIDMIEEYSFSNQQIIALREIMQTNFHI